MKLFVFIVVLLMVFSVTLAAPRVGEVIPELDQGFSGVQTMESTPEPSVKSASRKRNKGKIFILPNFRELVNIRQSEDVEFALNSTSAGFARVSSVGLTVQIGTSGTLNFKARAKAVDAESLSRRDSSFVGTLSEAEQEEYDRQVTTYSGGLDIKFMGFLGIKGGAKTTKEDMERSAARQGDYNLKSRAVAEILESTVEQDIEISGTLTATGVSFTPTTVNAFIKLSKLQLNDGSTLTVITTDPNELVAADDDGNVTDSDDGTIEIIEL